MRWHGTGAERNARSTRNALVLVARLGPPTLGVDCVYANRLDQLDLEVLRELVEHAFVDVTTAEVVDG